MNHAKRIADYAKTKINRDRHGIAADWATTRAKVIRQILREEREHDDARKASYTAAGH